MKYEMSTDYNALYEHLKAGGEALGRMLTIDSTPRFPVTHPVDIRPIHFPYWMDLMHYGKEVFIGHCTQYKLEWIAPCANDQSGAEGGPKDGTRAERDGEAGAPTSPNNSVSKEIIAAGNALRKAMAAQSVYDRAENRDAFAAKGDALVAAWDAALSKANLGEGMSELTNEEIERRSKGDQPPG